MVDLYGYRVGQRLMLPIGEHGAAFVVAGIWRDYVRQTGALQIRLADYRRLTGDTGATDAALTLERGVSAAQGHQIAFGNLKLWIQQRAVDVGRQQSDGRPGNLHYLQF